MLKRLTALLLCLLALLSLMPTAALAVSLTPPPDAGSEIHIHYVYSDNLPLTGATFRLYEIGRLDGDGIPVLNSRFSAFRTGLNLGDRSHWPEIASELTAFTAEKSVTASQTTRVSGDGYAHFPVAGASLRSAVYLIVPVAHVRGEYVYTGHPLLVELPTYDEQTHTAYWKIKAEPKIERTRYEGVACHVIVQWIDEGFEQYRPGSVDVKLLCNDAVADTATIGPNENWRHSFTGLHRETELAARTPRYQAAVLSSRRSAEVEPMLLEGWIDQEPTRKWSVRQNEVPRYTTTYNRVDDTFIITNRITGVTPSPSPTVSPKPSQKPDQLWPTGQLWWPVPVLIAGSLGVLAVGLVLSRKKRDD